ncbi:MAG: DinB family protein [Armatimonadetes bacterium]|nr:DinB family protein [Armatimonadota bacterium]
MDPSSPSLMSVYEGWAGFNTSLVRAVAPRSSEELAYRPAPGMRSAGEIARHLSAGRINWFQRMDPPGLNEVARHVPEWKQWEGNRFVAEDSLPEDGEGLARWLNLTWGMVEETLNEWTVEDLSRTYRHTYFGQTYRVSYQWTIWRIMAHDIYHGGQLTILFGAQEIDLPDLAGQGGHLTEPPLAETP